MKHRIDPTVDCVFKAILGKEENKNLLIHFLNAVLEPEKGSQIKDVTIINPYNEREFIGDKLTIVDVKAVDEKDKKYQIEIQLDTHPALASRILFTWSSIYHSQMQEGDNYKKLKPVISIWLLNGSLFGEIEECHLPFTLYNLQHKLVMTDQLAIHVLQLPKQPADRIITNEKERWIYCFREGKNVDTDTPPEILNTKEMRQVMKVMRRFSESQKDYLLYQSRLDAILTRNTILKSLEEAEKKIEMTEKKMEMTVKKLDRTVKEKEQAEKKFKSLRLLLEKKGIDLPDDE